MTVPRVDQREAPASVHASMDAAGREPASGESCGRRLPTGAPDVIPPHAQSRLANLVPSLKLLEAPIRTTKINLAFMNDLDIMAVRIEHPCRIIARIVFGPSLR
jgi:hypothetical protein